MWQQWVVSVIVALAGAYALWYWLPGSLRVRLGRVQKSLGDAPGCGVCSSCGSCASPGAPHAAAPESTHQPIWMKSQG